MAAADYATLQNDFGYSYSVTSYDEGLLLANNMFKFPWSDIVQYNGIKVDHNVTEQCSLLVADFRAADNDAYIALWKFARRWVRDGEVDSYMDGRVSGRQAATKLHMNMSGSRKGKRRRETENMLFSWMIMTIPLLLSVSCCGASYPFFPSPI